MVTRVINMATGAPAFPIGIVDVRDVVVAHITAAYLPDAAGRHILDGIVSRNGEFSF
jgi:hypothetical protein